MYKSQPELHLASKNPPRDVKINHLMEIGFKICLSIGRELQSIILAFKIVYDFHFENKLWSSSLQATVST